MTQLLLIYATVLVVLIAIDLLWLGWIAAPFYKAELAPLLRERPDLAIGALFYALFALGIVVLVVQPALAANDWWHAALYGAVLGLCAYGTYDLTNLATLRHWPRRLAFLDMAWGTALTTLAALAGFGVARLLAVQPT